MNGALKCCANTNVRTRLPGSLTRRPIFCQAPQHWPHHTTKPPLTEVPCPRPCSNFFYSAVWTSQTRTRAFRRITQTSNSLARRSGKQNVVRPSNRRSLHPGHSAQAHRIQERARACRHSLQPQWHQEEAAHRDRCWLRWGRSLNLRCKSCAVLSFVSY